MNTGNNDPSSPREIPNRENPDKTYPEQAPNTEPGSDNPINPQDDET